MCFSSTCCSQYLVPSFILEYCDEVEHNSTVLTYIQGVSKNVSDVLLFLLIEKRLTQCRRVSTYVVQETMNLSFLKCCMLHTLVIQCLLSIKIPCVCSTRILLVLHSSLDYIILAFEFFHSKINLIKIDA